MMMIARPALLTCLLTLVVAAPIALMELSRTPVEPREVHTVASRLADFGPAARARLTSAFGRASWERRRRDGRCRGQPNGRASCALAISPRIFRITRRFR